MPKYKYIFDEMTGEKIDSTLITEEYLASCSDSIRFNFSFDEFEGNKGIHARGTGDAERNIYYAMTKDCMARYFGYVQNIQGVDTIIFPAGQTEFTYEDSLRYVTDLVIDELALEFAWEGTRFGDLVRFAIATGDKDILAKRIAGREFSNEVTYHSNEYKFDASLYNFMLNEANWYLPLPAGVVDPVNPDEVPGGTLPEEGETPGDEPADEPSDEPAGEPGEENGEGENTENV